VLTEQDELAEANVRGSSGKGGHYPEKVVTPV
jgi:hypothetical protein